MQCVKYKDALQLHACMCREPVGKCTVERCDDIRHYLEKNTLPDNRNWEHRHDKLFFKSNPPRTPNLLGDLCLLPFDLSQSCDHTQPASSFGSTSGGSQFASSFTRSELWNQYHVSRPPDPRSDLEPQQVAELSDIAPSLSQDLPVIHGPARDGKVSLQPCQIHEQSAATPLSATCVPNIGQASGSISTQEVLWPLNRVLKCCVIYKGYYTVARRYEFYVRVARTISHSFASFTREILFLPREHKIHIFEPTCNVLFIIWRLNMDKFRFYCVSK